MAGIGIGNMGTGDRDAFLGRKRSAVRGRLRRAAPKSARTPKARSTPHYHNKDCKAYNDFRELLARTDIDAVHVATPDHWHALIVIEACRHGKDVYCQKPETRTLREGPLMVAAARRYGRVVSGGSQRVLDDYRKTVNKCWSGELGTIKSINVNVGPLSQPATCRPSRSPPAWTGTCGSARPLGPPTTTPAATATSAPAAAVGDRTRTIPAAA